MLNLCIFTNFLFILSKFWNKFFCHRFYHKNKEKPMTDSFFHYFFFFLSFFSKKIFEKLDFELIHRRMIRTFQKAFQNPKWPKSTSPLAKRFKSRFYYNLQYSNKIWNYFISYEFFDYLFIKKTKKL